MNNSHLKQIWLFLAWLIALIAMVVTLYSQYVLAIPPCPLCWYQRTALYPLVIILGMAAYRGRADVIPYAIPLSIISAGFALYQYAEQMIPGFAPIQFCTASSVQCSNIHFKWLGFITYPLLSFAASIIILAFLLLAHYANKKS